MLFLAYFFISFFSAMLSLPFISSWINRRADEPFCAKIDFHATHRLASKRMQNIFRSCVFRTHRVKTFHGRICMLCSVWFCYKNPFVFKSIFLQGQCMGNLKLLLCKNSIWKQTSAFTWVGENPCIRLESIMCYFLRDEVIPIFKCDTHRFSRARWRLT